VSAHPSRRRAALFVLILATAAVVLALVAVEVCARGLRWVSCTDIAGGFEVRDRWAGWRDRPGATGPLQRCVGGRAEFRTWVRINGRGLRGPEVGYARTPGVPRVLVVGDSFTAGLQVDLADHFLTRLAALLSKQAGRPVEVLNGGVNAWGTDNAILWFAHEGWRYHPDLVLLMFDNTNDIFENTHRLVAASAFYPDKPYFERVGDRLVRRNFPLARESRRTTMRRALVSWLYRRSDVFQRLVAANLTPGVVLPPAARPPDAVVGAVPSEVLLRDYPPYWDEAWRVTGLLLRRFRHVVEARGARPAVAIINAREEVSPERLRLAQGFFPTLRGKDVDADKPQRLALAATTAAGLPTIAMLDAFRARFAKDGTPGYFAWDMHWAPAGHALAATLLADGIRAQHLLPEPAQNAAVAPPSHGMTVPVVHALSSASR
jgi:hypothetical protein